MDPAILSVAIGVVTTVLGGAIKALVAQSGSIKVLQAEHKSLQMEVNEFKTNVKETTDDLKADVKSANGELKSDIERRFDKMELLIEKLFTFEREDHRRAKAEAAGERI